MRGQVQIDETHSPVEFLESAVTVDSEDAKKPMGEVWLSNCVIGVC